MRKISVEVQRRPKKVLKILMAKNDWGSGKALKSSLYLEGGVGKMRTLINRGDTWSEKSCLLHDGIEIKKDRGRLKSGRKAL